MKLEIKNKETGKNKHMDIKQHAIKKCVNNEINNEIRKYL